MERVIQYKCSVCGKIHETIEKTQHCLMSHPSIENATEKTWNDEINIPSKIKITLSDDRVFIYHMHNEEKTQGVKKEDEFLWW